MPIGTDRVLQLVGLLYEAATTDGGWQQPVDFLAEAYGGAATLLSQDTNTAKAGVFAQTGFNGGYAESYVNHFAPLNPWIKKLALLKAGEVATGSTLFPAAVFENTEFYNDWLRPQRLYHGISAIAANSGALITQASVVRPVDQPWKDGDIREWRQILPHIRRAIDVHRRLAAAEIQRDASMEGLDRAQIAAMITDAAGHIHIANKAATDLLRQRDGLVSVHDQLRAASPEATAALRRLLQNAADIGGGRALQGEARLCLARTTREPLILLASPIVPQKHRMILPDSLVLLLVCEPERRAVAVRPALLEQVFGLTAGEAAVAAAIAEGKTINEIAAERNTSLNTVRTQTKAIYEKTGTRGQVGLVARIVADPLLAERLPTGKLERN